MKDMGEADVILVSTPMDTSEKLMPNNGQTVSQLEYSRVIGCLIYAMTCTRPDIAFVMGKLSMYTSNLVLEGYTDVSWISNTKDNPSTSGWVFLLDGGAISWASKKQTCITGSTIQSEFVALVAARKEAEWLKNLLLEIPLWYKPIASISIYCDSAATLAKAYNQMYNGKSRHLGVRYNMIRELIMNEVISIEFVRSQQNLADHLTKGLARDLVIKSVEGMGLKELKHMYLHIIPRMCLEPAEKEDEVFTSQWNCIKLGRIVGNLVNCGFSSYWVMGLKVRSVLPLVTEHPDSDSGERNSEGLLISGFLQFEPSTGMLLSGLADGSGH
ncbi:zinc finger, CCHC-type containing protein [Tanacetum coccineum]